MDVCILITLLRHILFGKMIYDVHVQITGSSKLLIHIYIYKLRLNITTSHKHKQCNMYKKRFCYNILHANTYLAKHSNTTHLNNQ